MAGLQDLRNLMLVASGIALGAAYGLFLRWGAQHFLQSKIFVVMSIGFIFFLPFAVGFASVYIIEVRQPQPVWVWLLVSCAAVLLLIGGTMLPRIHRRRGSADPRHGGAPARNELSVAKARHNGTPLVVKSG